MTKSIENLMAESEFYRIKGLKIVYIRFCKISKNLSQLRIEEVFVFLGQNRVFSIFDSFATMTFTLNGGFYHCYWVIFVLHMQAFKIWRNKKIEKIYQNDIEKNFFRRKKIKNRVWYIKMTGSMSWLRLWTVFLV